MGDQHRRPAACRGQCIASVRAGDDDSREQTACRESNAKAANSDASQPSDFRSVLQSRSLPTLGGQSLKTGD
jgi:hypothetical protein